MFPGSSYKNIKATSISLSWSFLLKLCISLLAVAYVLNRILQEESFHFDVLSSPESTLAILALILMPLNLGLETRKWQVLLRIKNEDISFRLLFKGVLVGMSLGIFTPNRIGEYAGRLSVLPKNLRFDGGVFTLINRLSQMVITLIMGIGVFFLSQPLQIHTSYPLLASLLPWITAGLLFVLITMIFTLPLWSNILIKLIPRHSKFHKWTGKIMDIPVYILSRVLLLSLLRYFIFSLQYLLLIYAFGSEQGIFEVGLLVVMVFLIKSLAPIASFAELGIREAVAVTVGGWIGISSLTATSSAFALYVVNLVIPALLGLFLLYKRKN